MRVSEYEYEYIDEDENGDISEKRKNRLIKFIKNEVRKDKIAHCRILSFGKNNNEYKFMYEWSENNGIEIIGINNSVSGELENFKYFKRGEKHIDEEKLTNEEQEKLFIELCELRKNKNKDSLKEYRRIRNKLVIHNMKLAKWVVQWSRIKDIQISQEDKEQIAMLSLTRAVDTFDINKDYKFSTYATRVIYRGIISSCYQRNLNEAYFCKQLKKIEEFENEMLKQLNREPTNLEIVRMLGIDEKNIEKLKLCMLKQKESSLNLILEDNNIDILDGIYKDEESNKAFFVQDNTSNQAMISSCQEDIKKILDSMLDERGKKIISMHYGLDGDIPKTSEQIAKHFNISSARVMQIEHNAFERIRKFRKSKGLKDYINEFETKGGER